MNCSIKECENGSSKIYCPNRFTFSEMVTIGRALSIAPMLLSLYIDNKDNFNYSLPKDIEKAMLKENDKNIEDMMEVMHKVKGLIENVLN